MKKRLSAMGGGKYEFVPNELEKNINRREEFFNINFEYLQDELNKIALDYSKKGLGDFDNCKKELLKRLVLSLR